MKLVRDARTLKSKAIESLRTAMTAFNSYDDAGRVTTVLMHSQHACEMLLKAVLVQGKTKVFDKGSGKSIGFEKCLGLCQGHHGLTADEAGIMRAIDAQRDAAQHWFVFVSEDLLYMQTRALITAFDAYLKRKLDTVLQDHIPPRVLPISTIPPGDFEFLVDKEFNYVNDLLQPGRRARDEARARIRAMLAMEAIVTDEVEISERDINRIEKAIRGGAEFAAVFPRLATVGTTTEGEGVNLVVHFTKKLGAPVHYVGGDDPAAAAAVREVDLRRKFHLQRNELATKVGLTQPKAKVLRAHLGIDDDPSCCHVFEFGSQKIPCFSDNATRRMQEALPNVDMADLWANRKG
ncbi:hypothetical protein JET14_11585 [Martelella lutilitoris]|uniref:DUF3644 domain-containing protein n=1 Tax=Martelella lutilitoris TaxID=2583532 RepID=A0A7T7HH06_9HYPH|nr:hypothetical protein [Martelella lutilitoris]QQM28987.1 hypothetical protein JET14_11585 [Martelella lutilitoris]